MDFETNYRKLSPEQKRAVDTIDGPVLVIAGPGTGKTQLLALRAANILKKTDTAPQNILCLTYTEVGARNMRSRLAQFIDKAAYDIQISTYHGFGSEIIRNYSEYFTEFDDEQPVDKIGQNVIMHEIYKELPATNILWKSRVYLKDALSFISESKRARLLPDDLRKIANDNDAFIQNTKEKVAEILSSVQKMIPSVIPNFSLLDDYLTKIYTDSTAYKSIAPISHLATLDLNDAIAQALETGKTPALTAWKNKWLAKDSEDKWIFAGKRENRKIRAGADIYDMYLTKLSEKKLFDFDDMILRAIRAIKENDELRFTLQEKYQYIMLDEFQDTNLSQLELIELLTNNPVNEGRPDILAVGDDDQAIYSFQGANLGNMLSFHAMYRDVTTITLKDNWRSHEDVLSISENISSQIEERLHKGLGFSDKKLQAMNQNLPKKSRVERHNFKSDIAQFSWVAQQIKNEIKGGLKPSEIAIIAPKHKYLEPLVPYLKSLNIPVRYDKRENVFDDSHIQSLITMVQLVIALRDNKTAEANSLWPAVLSAQEWRIPTSSIWKLSWAANKNYFENGENNWQALMLDDEQFKLIALFFAQLASASRTLTLELILDYLTGVTPLVLNEIETPEYTSPYFEYYFGKESREENPVGFMQLLSNLTVLRQHLRSYKKTEASPLTIDDFIEFVKAYADAEEKLLNTNPYHSSDDAVQLLTAYGAKGLEFGAVFTLATVDEVWGMKARSNSNKISLPINLKIIRQAGLSKDERKRLFFVALTRAKHMLIMTSYDQDFSGKVTTPLEFLAESQLDDSQSSPYLPSSQKQVMQSDSEALTIDQIETYWHAKHLKALSDETLNELIKPQLETFQLSATHLNSFTDLEYGGPESFYLNTILRFPKSPSVSGQYGSAMHETLESLHNILRKEGELPDLDRTIEIFEKKLKSQRLLPGDFSQQFSRGKRALEHFLPWWWHNFNPSNEAEINLKNEGSFVGDAHLSGKLDQLVINHDDHEIGVVDYKTGTPIEKWDTSLKVHKYKQQLLFYKLLLESSHSYEKFTVTSGRLVFVEPDDDDQMHELTLQYDDKDIIRTKNLIQAVWNCIMKLDIPSTEHFEKDAKGTVAFENWLIENYLPKE